MPGIFPGPSKTRKCMTTSVLRRRAGRKRPDRSPTYLARAHFLTNLWLREECNVFNRTVRPSLDVDRQLSRAGLAPRQLLPHTFLVQYLIALKPQTLTNVFGGSDHIHSTRPVLLLFSGNICGVTLSVGCHGGQGCSWSCHSHFADHLLQFCMATSSLKNEALDFYRP